MESRRARGLPAPLLDSLSPLPDHLVPYWDAFAALSRARASTGFGPCPIPISEILAVCDYFCLNPDEAVPYIRALDDEFLTEHTKKAQRQAKRATPRSR